MIAPALEPIVHGKEIAGHCPRCSGAKYLFEAEVNPQPHGDNITVYEALIPVHSIKTCYTDGVTWPNHTYSVCIYSRNGNLFKALGCFLPILFQDKKFISASKSVFTA